ncbi:MAG: hypothetical protein CSA35_00965 [Dethiosulfovibrio peptidovorans]|nr:MAG: hypothetical protein CSA35_00965 [Dethiosulfovibrio peptidovorans]
MLHGHLGELGSMEMGDEKLSGKLDDIQHIDPAQLFKTFAFHSESFRLKPLLWNRVAVNTGSSLGR